MIIHKLGKRTLYFQTKSHHHEESFRVELPHDHLRDKIFDEIFNLEGEAQWEFIRALEVKYKKDNYLTARIEKKKVNYNLIY